MELDLGLGTCVCHIKEPSYSQSSKRSANACVLEYPVCFLVSLILPMHEHIPEPGRPMSSSPVDSFLPCMVIKGAIFESRLWEFESQLLL
jgi:hypothetical protein